MDNARNIAVSVLKRVLSEGAYSNIELKRELNSKDIDDRDKALITEIVYGTIKYKYTIDIILKHYIKSELKKLNIDVLNILRISIYQIRYLDKIPSFAVVNEAVELAKMKAIKNAKFVNAVLRNYIRNDGIDYCKHNAADEELAFKYSFPLWLVKMFLHQYGLKVTENILSGLNKTPSVTVRVNNLKAGYDETYDKLIENGYSIEEGKICPEAIVIKKGKNIENNPLFKDGLITVQDESAMLVAPSMDLKEDMVVLDLCSAPGGKTSHIAEIMKNTGKIFAFDIHRNKLSLIKQNVERLGITNVKCSELDAANYSSDYEKIGDRVLVDAPCSGLGIIAKKPEIKWTKSKESLKSILKVQRDIVSNAARYVKPGGKLIYSTCTLNKQENEENIKWFIKKYPNFEIEPIYFGKLSNIIYHKEGFITILPDELMDGFFIAKMVRRR